jgi:hypothetical protein
MSEGAGLALRVVDARELDPAIRAVLRPGELLPDADGRLRRLPRFFYEVPSWQAANEIELTPHFRLAELMRVDVREAAAVRDFPRYVPCAVVLLAAQLELFRQAVDAPVFVAANGGYRSPGHALNAHATPHCWGAAANLSRIGDEYLDTRERIEKYNALAQRHLPGVWVRPYGHGRGFADDHVHLELGYVTLVPRGLPGEDAAPPAAAARHTEGAEAEQA